VAPPTNAPRPGRALAVVALVLVGLYTALFLGKPHAPKLGLDLRGGTSVILTPKAGGGAKVTKASLSKAVEIIRQRVNGIGVAEAEVTTQGGRNIVIAVPGKGRSEVLNKLVTTAQLRFREVLTVAAASAPVPTATPTPSGSASPKPSPGSSIAPGPKPTASSTSNGRALTGALLPAATPSPTATSSARPSASPPPVPTPPPSASPSADPAAAAQFATIDCAKVTNRAGGSEDDPGKELVTCNQDGSQKYLLAPAKVIGTDVKTANANQGNSQNLGEWQVDIRFTGKGQKKFTSLTQATVGKQVAIVLDGIVVSAPTIQTVINGDAQITGQFSQKEAKDLANVLKYGALPLTFVTQSAETISPTLGDDQLRAGLLAGAIGLGLVVIYSLIYYRGLGLVTIASLALSGLVIFAGTTLLGRAIGYTLTLAGIAGYIVAVGITADSFVVFFERLRDEVREGRTLRSAVDKAWPRARRTILSADTVSLLAAGILYFLSVGSVRGFAFTLGLSTIVDLFVVFLFTKPLLNVLARTKLYGSGSTFSGLGRARMGNVTEPVPAAAGRRTTAPKEA